LVEITVASIPLLERNPRPRGQLEVPLGQTNVWRTPDGSDPRDRDDRNQSSVPDAQNCGQVRGRRTDRQVAAGFTKGCVGERPADGQRTVAREPETEDRLPVTNRRAEKYVRGLSASTSLIRPSEDPKRRDRRALESAPWST
jgi:hypothetical protein